MENKYKRSGDIYFHPIKEIPSDLKEVKHNNNFVFATGEASNHNHIIAVKDKKDLVIRQDAFGNYYFELLADGELKHLVGKSNQVADHKTIPIKKGLYRQVHERELDFASGVTRKVID